MAKRIDPHRVRIKDNAKIETVPLVLLDDAAPVGAPPLATTYSYRTRTKFEQHHDVVGFPQLWNPCFHEKFSVDGNIQNPPVVLEDNEGGLTQVLQGLDNFDVLDVIRGSIPGPPATLVDDLSVKAEQEFIKATDTDTSLLNFLIELIQGLGKLADSVRKLVTLWEKIVAAAKAAYHEYLKMGKSHQESLWLAWNFAIKPTISDLKGIFSGVREARKRLQYLKRVNHTTTLKHFRRKDVWSPGDVEVGFGGPADSIQSSRVNGSGVVKRWMFIAKIEEYHLDFNCQADVRYDIDDAYLDDTMGLGVVWSAMQGLYNPEAVLWEACPFSWLADYFVSERQKLLHQMFDLSPLKDGVIQRACHSWKLRAKVKILREEVHEVYDNYTIVDESTVKFDVATVTYDLYVRHLGLPIAEESPLRLPGWQQLANLFALLIQLGRKR